MNLTRWLETEWPIVLTILVLVAIPHPIAAPIAAGLAVWLLLQVPGFGRTEWPLVIGLVFVPFVFSPTLSMQAANLVVFCLLALGLNVVVGYTGLLNLGIAAFFGIGAYVTGILVSPAMPFEWNYFAVFFLAGIAAAIAGLALAAPTLQLRGDYLALVTLGFGEVVRFSMRNLTYITNGTKTINPIVSPFASLPELTWNTPWGSTWSILSGKTYLYFFCLLCLAVAVFVLRNLERSRLGRAWVAIREDELAASCMGIDVTRVKLAAFACGATLAGLAGSLYALLQSNTSAPETYDFALSITMLACIILGGLGSMRGAMAGVLLLVGFDLILAPWVDEHLQQIVPAGRIGEILKLNNWRYMIFGLSLVLMMRLRPEGLLPSERVQRELHEPDEQPHAQEAA